MKNIRLLIAAVGLVLSGPATLWAEQPPVERAQQATEALNAAAELMAQADSGSDRVAALSGAIRAYEQGLAAMREGLRAAAIRERYLTLDFESRREQLSQLLGVLQTLERATTPLLLIHPTGPVGTARSGMMMSEVTPALNRQAEELRAQLQELAALQAFQQSAARDLEWGLSGVQQARVNLSQAINDRTDLPRRFADDPVRVQIMADNSQTLQGFAEKLHEAEATDPPATAVPFADAAGRLPLPTEGTVLRGFNEEDAAGLKRPGIVLSTRPLSLITAPWPATVRYAGPFLDYGNVIILEPDAEYLIVLAGLDQVYVEVGQILDQDEPVGLLGGSQPATEEFLIEASQGGGTIDQETLYIEIRKDGTPTDPARWFALGNN
jgi:septal ring factor EnvC (AmiA/AmiB activator)